MTGTSCCSLMTAAAHSLPLLAPALAPSASSETSSQWETHQAVGLCGEMLVEGPEWCQTLLYKPQEADASYCSFLGFF